MPGCFGVSQFAVRFRRKIKFDAATHCRRFRHTLSPRNRQVITRRVCAERRSFWHTVALGFSTTARNKCSWTSEGPGSTAWRTMDRYEAILRCTGRSVVRGSAVRGLLGLGYPTDDEPMPVAARKNPQDVLHKALHNQSDAKLLIWFRAQRNSLAIGGQRSGASATTFRPPTIKAARHIRHVCRGECRALCAQA